MLLGWLVCLLSVALSDASQATFHQSGRLKTELSAESLDLIKSRPLAAAPAAKPTPSKRERGSTLLKLLLGYSRRYHPLPSVMESDSSGR